MILCFISSHICAGGMRLLCCWCRLRVAVAFDMSSCEEDIANIAAYIFISCLSNNKDSKNYNHSEAGKTSAKAVNPAKLLH